MHKTVHHNQELPVQNIKSTEVKKPLVKELPAVTE